MVESNRLCVARAQTPWPRWLTMTHSELDGPSPEWVFVFLPFTPVNL